MKGGLLLNKFFKGIGFYLLIFIIIVGIVQFSGTPTEKVETRIALFIVESLENENSNMVELPMSKKDLASYLGTTPETVSKKLTELEDAGYIERLSNKQIKILDLDGLLLV